MSRFINTLNTFRDLFVFCVRLYCVFVCDVCSQLFLNKLVVYNMYSCIDISHLSISFIGFHLTANKLLIDFLLCQSRCKAMGGQLASIDSMDVQLFISDLVKNSNKRTCTVV